MTREMTGAKMVVQALKEQGVDTVFGYPGGAVLPIYDEIFQQNDIRHMVIFSGQLRKSSFCIELDVNSAKRG